MYWLVPIICTILSACATTGNPNEGGLFGWSEEKANARQEELREDLDRSQSEESAAQIDSRQLEQQIAKTKSENASLDETLDSYLKKNSALRKEYAALIANNAEVSRELEDLTLELQTTQDQVTPDGDEAHAGDNMESRVDFFDRQNRRIHTAILLLSQ